MYNPDTLITAKEEQYEIPPAPVFYEEDYPYPWKPFKSNGGTGDPPSDWSNPSTTVEPTPQLVQPKLCPFRKHIHFKNDKDPYDVALNFANHMEEEFLPCIRERCAVWNEKGQVCCY